MTRIAVTGSKGQVATALAERAVEGVEIIALARPSFALEDRASVLATIEAAKPDVVINAAAYTAVDKAESEEDLAMRVNGDGAGHVAEAAAKAGVPLLHLSTDYVFDGALDRPYREDDPTGPTGAYGRSKLSGEKQVAERSPNSVILRTAWVYSPFGANFVRTMLRLNETRDEVGVVADQRGNPTSALDIADALIVIAGRMRDGPVSNAARSLQYDRVGRRLLGGFRRSRVRERASARPKAHAGQAHRDRRLPDAGAAARQFAARQCEAS